MASEPLSPTPPAPAAPAAPRRRRWLAWALGGATLGLAAVLAAGAGLWWSLHSDKGGAWLLGHVPGLQVSGVQGALLGDLQAERVVIALPREGKVTLTGFRWRGLQVDRAPGALWARLRFESLQAGRVDIQPSQASPEPTVAPTDLSLPIELEVASLEVQALYIAGAGEVPVRDLQARLHLGAQDGTQHRIELTGASYDQLKASADATLGTRGTLPLDLKLQLVQTAPLANAQWSAQATLAGPLAAARLQATLRAQPAPAAGGKPLPAQSLDLSALLRPFEAWPLGDLDARADALDLQAFLSSAPRTSLSGQAQVRSSGLGQTAIVTASLRNAEAGLWSAGQLPLRQLDLDLRGQPGDPGTLSVQRFDAELGGQATVAGRISGQGRWAKAGWDLEMALAALQPDQLDARAAAMLLSGPVKLSGTAPGSAATQVTVRAELNGRVNSRESALSAAPKKPAPRARPATSVSAASAPASAPASPPSATASGPAASNAGRRPARSAAAGNGAQRDVSLRLDATWTNDASAQRIELREALASTGAARASASGTAERAAPDGSPWRVRGQAALTDFDPVPWWPGREDSPWRQGPHRLNAKGDFDLTLPTRGVPATVARSGSGTASGITSGRGNGTTATPAAGAVFAAWRGRATVTLRDSLLAGVPLSGEASLRATDGNPAEVQLQLDAAGNQLRASGRVATRTGATDDHWEARVTAPSLDPLAPLWRLLRPAGAQASLAGTLNGNIVVDGRWPALESRGEAQASALRVDTLAVQRADATWRVSSRADSPVEARVTLTDIAVGGATVDRTELRLDGTGRAHRLSLQAESKAQPPAWVDGVQRGVQGTPSATSAASAASAASASSTPTPAATTPLRGRSVASLEAQGGLFDNAAGALAGWRGTVQQLELRSADPQAAPWLRTRDVSAQLQWADGTAEGPVQITLQPGRAELLGAALRWERVDWRAADTAGAPARIEAQAELEPFAVAPLLQRLQPEFGWGGDLLVTGRLEIRSAPTFHADVVLERSRGDLSVTDEVGTQALGLSDLRLGLNVADGVWSFTQGLAGSSLGVAAGALVARTTPDATWPAPQTPVSGVLELQVANLGTWGTWVPAGWRLGGALRVGATIAGTFGAPEYIGELTGRELSVRNFLQGVNVTDGDVAIKLQGTSARIERFSAKAGSGSVRLEGGATFGTTPQVLIDLTAEQFTLLGRVDRRIVTSGAAKLRLDREALALTGQFGIDEGLIDFSRSDAPSLSDDVTVLRAQPGAAPKPVAAGTSRPTAEAAGAVKPAAEAAGTLKPTAEAASAPKPTGQLAGKTALDLRVNLGQRLRLRGRGIDTGLRGELRITSPSSRVAVNGTVSTADGTYQAYGQKLTIDRGELVFNGPVENPRLDIEATRPNLDVRVGVAVSGTAVNPRIRLFSEPELSEIDKLSWLVLGRASDGLGRADTALLQRAAVALLSGEGEGVTDQFTRAIGLDEVSLRQTEGEVRETIVSLGKQLSRRWYVGYERSLNATAGTWQLIYRIAQRFTLRAQSGLDNSLDVIWTWRWN